MSIKVIVETTSVDEGQSVEIMILDTQNKLNPMDWKVVKTFNWFDGYTGSGVRIDGRDPYDMR